MSFADPILEVVGEAAPALMVTVTSVVVLWGAHWFLIRRNRDRGGERLFPAQLIMLGLTVVALLAVVISLPASTPRKEIIGLIGILLSGMIALSSTTMVANLMAGILLRITTPFRTGDFIQVNEFFGRVSERGLFDTEIQSETRELIAIPNNYLVSHPVSSIRSSGAIVTATLSLGYDVHHAQVEPLLLEAAEQCGLTEPFVHMLELGDYSITYQVAGLLTEVKGLVTARSRLRRAVVEVLHEHAIEIMSPSYMVQRRVDPGEAVIPAHAPAAPEKETGDAEAVIFDKAEQAEQTEKEKEKLTGEIKELESALKEASKDERAGMKDELETRQARLKELAAATHEEDEETGGTEPVAPAE